MTDLDPIAARDFAVEVVRQLRAGGYEALWAGGCVRDQLLGRTPKDYDVATNATPAEIRASVRQKTIAIGAAFGVITVLGPRLAGQVEVATFRRDADYSDGRHPDAVTFTNAKEDALRRDFTINGLFWDPIEQEVIDYVGGQQDLAQGLVRAIGDPHQRIREDKLRMLRAVRMTTTFQFQLDPLTMRAVQDHATEIKAVSAERITDELRRMLSDTNRRAAVELMADSGLLAAILPEADRSLAAGQRPASTSWRQACEMLADLPAGAFTESLAVLLREYASTSRPGQVLEICRRCKLSNRETDEILFCLKHEQLARSADRCSWAELQPVLAHPLACFLVEYAAAVARILGDPPAAIALCRQRLAWPAEQLDPPPLLGGNDLHAAGIPKGPIYRTILEAVRKAQLLDQVADREAALELAQRTWRAIN